MLRTICILALTLIGTILASTTTKATSNLAIVEAPSYLTFNYNKGTLSFGDFKKLLVNVVGYSTREEVSWQGLVNTDALKFPNAIMLFIANSKLIDMDLFSSKNIQIDQDEEINTDTFNYLKDAFKNKGNLIKPENLDEKLETTSDCISQMNPEVYVFNVTNVDNQGLIKVIDEKKTEYRKRCSSDLLVFLLTHSDAVVKRSKRQAQDTSVSDSGKITNLAEFYSDQYPAMFNLLFWTSLFIALAVFGISYGMWFMDPGLDTVIYRMTSQRIKKDQ